MVLVVVLDGVLVVLLGDLRVPAVVGDVVLNLLLPFRMRGKDAVHGAGPILVGLLESLLDLGVDPLGLRFEPGLLKACHFSLFCVWRVM